MTYHLCRLMFLISFKLITAELSFKPLRIDYDLNNGRRANLRWNDQLNSQNVTEILYRTYTSHPIATATDGRVREVYGLWTTLITSPIPKDLNHWFIKPRFCLKAEFEIAYNTTAGVRTYGPQILDLPIPHLLNNSNFRISRLSLDPSDDRIHIRVEVDPKFAFWTGAGGQLRNFEPTLTPRPCKSLFKSSIPGPEISRNHLEISLDKRYAQHGCTFLYGFIGEIYLPDEECSVEFRLPENQSLPIELDCGKLPGLNCPTNQYASVGDCSNCNPVISREAIFETDQETKLLHRVVKVSWNFTDSRQPLEVRIRTAKAMLTGLNTVSNESSITTETIKWYQKSVTLRPWMDTFSSLETPLYTVQMCAIYSQECPNAQEWSQHNKYPIYFKDLEETWRNLSNQPNFENIRETNRFAYYNRAELITFNHILCLTLTLCELLSFILGND